MRLAKGPFSRTVPPPQVWPTTPSVRAVPGRPCG